MTTGPRSFAWLVWLGLLASCGQDSASAADAKSERAAALVDVLAVQVGPIASSIEATANLVAERQVAVVAEQDGRLLELAVDEGQDIAAGDLVGVLDGRNAKHAIAAAKIKVSGASATHGRADKLARQQLLAAEELEKLGNARESAAQELSLAQWQLTRTRVRAPISGRVTKRHVVAGKWVRTGDPIVDVTDFGVLVARIHIPERDALRLEPGRQATLVLQAAADVRFTGTVRRIAEVVDVKSGTVEIVVEVTQVPPQVRSGSFVAIRIEREREAMAQWIPREAIVRESSGAVVFVVEDGVARRRELELGTEQGARVAVRSGVVAGELVVLAGQSALR
ncbi:MAG: efflux RND transporter periplasmic adaptor subunit, partial [Deltaproteobacteria bacterium]|nr:efflux RND transporter periplasmic adaptor subunit [Nannocystaceae bacterium]